MYLKVLRIDRGMPEYGLLPGEKPRKESRGEWTPKYTLYGPLETDENIYKWLEDRGWEHDGGGTIRKVIDGILHVAHWSSDLEQVLPIEQFPTFEKAAD